MQNPSYVYSLPGSYAVSLIASNAFGSDTSLSVVVVNYVIANFSIADTVYVLANSTFQNTSAGGVNYLWDFDDGNLSTNTNPIHAFLNQGSYGVTLTTTDGSGCSNTYTDTIVVVYDPNSIQKISSNFNLNIWPNPSNGTVNISLSEFANSEVIVSVYNAVGQEISKEIFKKGGSTNKILNLSDESNGLYVIKVSNGIEEKSKKILINK